MDQFSFTSSFASPVKKLKVNPPLLTNTFTNLRDLQEAAKLQENPEPSEPMTHIIHHETLN